MYKLKFYIFVFIQIIIEIMSKLDTLDFQLLNLLQENAKYTNKELASKLNLSVTAVFERIKKLEREQIIHHYTAILNREKINKGFIVFCHVKLIQHTKEYITQFEKEVQQLEEVLECFHVSGDYDYLLKVCLEDMESYRTFMVTKLTALNHIGSTQSSFMIGEVKNTTAYPL